MNWNESTVMKSDYNIVKPADFILKLASKCNIYEILTHQTLDKAK